MEASRACRWRRIAAKRGQFPAVAMAAIFLGAVRPTFVLNRPFSRRSVLGVVGAGVAITEEPVFAESPDSLDSVLQFSNAVAASKAQKFRTNTSALDVAAYCVHTALDANRMFTCVVQTTTRT
ncbi:hypothetical protein AK812_SmicGene27905 [Symbiodinium microadriaticum]|uniref:Uncharacterized protein n=1 Tax=Symbiodinium microadriaticum TaxID=2951 RepID=A0A1Q9D5S7_SYMMI|nr:hypothetical protein AK812_SmicGene27905 [Symbiodinium microadriaticum]